MTTVPRVTRRTGTAGSIGPVVAGLVNDGSAVGVAGAAVREAIRLGTTVHFVQVMSRTLSEADLADSDRATFSAALRALRGHPRTPSTFELVQGDPQEVLVERSRGAAVLVIGEDASTPAASVADYCLRHARCTVQTVSPR